jgi:hypothetical protein
VYQGELALLLAIDPAAPDGDRLVGYTLMSNTKAVDQDAIKAFLQQLQAAGILAVPRDHTPHRRLASLDECHVAAFKYRGDAMYWACSAFRPPL